MKTIGIIGGLGPETTAKFYLDLISFCLKFNKIQRPEIIISSIPLPFDVEEEAIAEGKGEEGCVSFITEAARKLEKAGVDFIVMPCNSLHTYIDEIRGAVKIPVLSIVEETVKFLKKEEVFEVGVISTTITLKNKLYEKALTVNGIKQVLPNESQQIKIGKLIHNLVINKYGSKDKKELKDIINDLKKRGIKHILLACTDLQLLMPKSPTLKIYDTMKILIDSSVEEIIKE